MHHLKHSRDNLLQKFCLFADYFICNPLRHRQNALQPIENAQRYLVIFVLFPQKLNLLKINISFNFYPTVTSTNLKRGTDNTENCL